MSNCTLCHQPASAHCDLDEPGVDHAHCEKMHHEFRAAISPQRGGDLRARLEKLKKQQPSSLCEPECYGRCRVCPAEWARELLTLCGEALASSSPQEARTGCELPDCEHRCCRCGHAECGHANENVQPNCSECECDGFNEGCSSTPDAGPQATSPANEAAPTREQMIGFAQRNSDDAWLHSNTHTAEMFAAIADALRQYGRCSEHPNADHQLVCMVCFEAGPQATTGSEVSPPTATSTASASTVGVQVASHARSLSPSRITPRTNSEALPHLVTVPDSARWYGCSPSTIRELIRTGKLQRVKLGRLDRVPRESLIRYAGGVGIGIGASSNKVVPRG